jgi:hypothetical protein
LTTAGSHPQDGVLPGFERAVARQRRQANVSTSSLLPLHMVSTY